MMESTVVSTRDIGLLGNSISVKSLRQDLTIQALNWLNRWQHSYLSVFLYSAIIALVALYDISLTIKYATSLAQLEVNPIGRWLMNIEATEVYLLQIPSGMYFFLKLKALGTILVIGIIHLLVRWRLDMGHAVALGVSMFQLGLAAYLTFR